MNCIGFYDEDDVVCVVQALGTVGGVTGTLVSLSADDEAFDGIGSSHADVL